MEDIPDTMSTLRALVGPTVHSLTWHAWARHNSLPPEARVEVGDYLHVHDVGAPALPDQRYWVAVRGHEVPYEWMAVAPTEVVSTDWRRYE